MLITDASWRLANGIEGRPFTLEKSFHFCAMFSHACLSCGVVTATRRNEWVVRAQIELDSDTETQVGSNRPDLRFPTDSIRLCCTEAQLCF